MWVRHNILIDGSEEFTTSNAETRKMTIKWSPLLEAQLVGYHVYRKCEVERATTKETLTTASTFSSSAMSSPATVARS